MREERKKKRKRGKKITVILCFWNMQLRSGFVSKKVHNSSESRGKKIGFFFSSSKFSLKNRSGPNKEEKRKRGKYF